MNCKVLQMKIDGFCMFLWHAQSTFFHFCNNLLDGKHMWFQKLQHHLHNRHFWSIGKSPIAPSYWRVQPNHTYNYKLLRHLKCSHPIPIFAHHPMNIESFGTEQGFRVSKIWFLSLHFPVHSLCSALMHSSFLLQTTDRNAVIEFQLAIVLICIQKSTLHMICIIINKRQLIPFLLPCHSNYSDYGVVWCEYLDLFIKSNQAF